MPSFRFFFSRSSGLGLWCVMVWCQVWFQSCGDQSVAPTGYSISGQVVGQTSYLSEVTIYLSGSVQDTAWTDAEGRFAFADLPEGRYRLVPFKDEHLFFPAEQEIVLTGEDAVGVEFVEVFAELEVSVDQLEVDETPQRTVVEVTNGGLGQLVWQVRHGSAWLSVEGVGFDGEVEKRADGSLAGQGAGVLTIETSGEGLAAGVYADTLYVQSNGGEVAIPVQMHIADPIGVNNADGTFRIAFISNFRGNIGENDGWSFDLWVMDGDGGNPVNLTDDEAHNFGSAWSPDGQRIAFSRTLSVPDIDYDLWVIDADGSNLVQLTQGPNQDHGPAWSPDGQRIAYTSRDEEGTQDLWVMDADGSNPVNLTLGPSQDQSPVWSPDGQRIAYISRDEEGTADIWVMDANGEYPVNLTASSEDEFAPSWSPDARHIAYVSRQDRESTAAIWVMDGDGGNPVNLTNDQANNLGASWSPDGQRIAYVRQLGEEDEQIWVMNADGTDQVPLTEGFRSASRPVWTPDGSRVLFSAFVSDSTPSPVHIFSISSDGFDVINLTEDFSPDGQHLHPAVSLSP